MNTGSLTRQNLLRVAKTHAFAILLIGSVLAVLVFNVLRAGETVETVGEVLGTLQGVHVVQTNVGTGTMFAVALPSGEVVMVSPPIGTPFKENAKVVLVQRRTTSGHNSFVFQAYAP